MFLFKSELNIYLRIPETPTALLRRRRVARHETHDFGSVVIAVDRHFNADRDFSHVPTGERGREWGSA
jgi:hypothetical protein